MEAGSLETPFGKKEKNPYEKQMQDSSMVKAGMEIMIDLRGGEKHVEGVVTYADGRWLNVKQYHGLGSTPCYRPQITAIEILEENAG